MVTSGNSSCRSERTSPIDMCARSATATQPPSGRARAGKEGKLELADLKLVAVLDRTRFDPFAIEVRPVQRADITHDETRFDPLQFGVPARNGDVVEKDVAVRVAPDG